jgi:peptide-methionine (S)-S-oxide reductase
MNKELQTAIFGGGCFWCMEAVFSELKGINNIVTGYAGGHKEEPNYKEVSSGKTGHAETIKIEFDSDIISYDQLLDVFFHTHDPTTLNRQGLDIGEQYRSIILYMNKEQRQRAGQFIEELEKNKEFSRPIVTELEPFDKFYQAEEYHQQYYAKNPNKTYCQLVITPKINKFHQRYSKLLK